MTQISGSLICVTEKPAAVSEVLVRAPRLRTTSNAVVTTEPDRYTVTDGQVTFPCAPGPAVLTLISGGMPVSTVLPIVVADAASMTLQDAVVAAGLVDTSTRSQLEQLAAEATQAITGATQAVEEATQAVEEATQAVEEATQAVEAAARAESAAARAEQSEANAGDFAAVATTAAAEAVDAMEQAAASAAAFSIYTGTGFPEGKVTAPVGSTYTDSEATNGAVRWIKTSGAGNTGWQVEYGDTGWRDLIGLVDPEFPLGTSSYPNLLMVRRVNDTIHYIIDISSTGANGARKLIDFPSGFKPTSRATYLPTGYSGSPVAYASPILTISLSASNQWLRYQWTFHANDPWPTTLPGTPA